MWQHNDSVVMLSVIMLSVVILSVVTPLYTFVTIGKTMAKGEVFTEDALLV